MALNTSMEARRRDGLAGGVISYSTPLVGFVTENAQKSGFRKTLQLGANLYICYGMLPTLPTNPTTP
jgi:hypothetical protein